MMDVKEPLEQFESEPQEPLTPQAEESRAPSVDLARQEETAQETESVQSVEEEVETDSSSAESEI